MIKVLIIGAGAIGRGYLPWVLNPQTYDLHFVDSNEQLIRDLRNQGRYTSFMTGDGDYLELTITNAKYWLLEDIEVMGIDAFDFVICCVGPRSFLSLAELFRQGTTPIVCLENDKALVAKMRQATNRDNIYFGIPDVISSNVSSDHLAEQYPHSLITEQGELFIDIDAADLGGMVNYCSITELKKQWIAKLYIHNTPHCIAAYLGKLAGAEYIHEAMQNSFVSTVVKGAAEEMADMVVRRFDIEPEFAQYYLDKEIDRFANNLLFDPISRVAREPFRKLALDDRLVGACRLALIEQIMPANTLMGLMSAFCFDDPEDNDAHISLLFKSLSPEDFLILVIGLGEHDVLFRLILDRWDDCFSKLECIVNE